MEKTLFWLAAVLTGQLLRLVLDRDLAPHGNLSLISRKSCVRDLFECHISGIFSTKAEYLLESQ